MVKKQIFYLLYIYFLRFNIIVVCGKKYILPNITKSRESEPNVFGTGAAWKKIPGAGAAWKKSEAEAAEKLAGSSALVKKRGKKEKMKRGVSYFKRSL